MTNDKSPSASTQQDSWTKSERGSLELKIAELTGVAEHLTQMIAVSQRHAERLQIELEDFRRQKQLAIADSLAQDELNAQKRHELHSLSIELKRNEGLLIAQEERIRAAIESVELAEKNSKQAIEAIQEECREKMKAIKQEFDSERERLNIELEVQNRETETAIRHLREELSQQRKKQQRNLEVEHQEAKKKAEDSVTRLLQEGKSKNEALIKATEVTALEVHRESETAAKRLLQDANQKATEIIRAAQIEAEEIRRRTHNSEINFLKEKNSGLAELKVMVANAREEAQDIIAHAIDEAKALQQKAEAENEAKLNANNQKISQARKAAEKETQDFIQKARTELAQEARSQEAQLAYLKKSVEEEIAHERQRVGEEARMILTQARERSQIILETASNEKHFKLEEIKATEATIFETARQAAATITHDADKIALTLVEEARERARTIERTLDAVLAEAQKEGAKIRAQADAYFEKIKRELPDPEEWEHELARIRKEEQGRLHALIEPTVKNYLAAIDIAINKVFLALPQKYQNHAVIQEFTEAIGEIQRKKNLINFAELISRSAPSQPSSQTQKPIRGAS